MTDNHDCNQYKQLHREGYAWDVVNGQKIKYIVYTEICSKCGRVLGGTLKVRE
jgi:hypothetical protein